MRELLALALSQSGYFVNLAMRSQHFTGLNRPKSQRKNDLVKKADKWRHEALFLPKGKCNLATLSYLDYLLL